ncbi:MAG: hypothetical protein H6715_05255 [Myxococcales bacterium]|nr:hypothetical protein [Myxococcales bacterium]
MRKVYRAQNKRGKIINAASKGSNTDSFPMLGVYSATKFAVRST